MKIKKIKLPVLSLSGGEKNELDLPSEIFGTKINLALMAQAVRVYLSNQRKAFAKTKNRGEVRGSGKKIWRQKGTGRARHRDRYAPIFVGGGVAHGPRGNGSFKMKLSKKMRQGSLFSALSAKMEEKRILIVDGLKEIEPKTKVANGILTKVVGVKKDESYLIILPNIWDKTLKGLGNVANLSLSQVNDLNCYLVLNYNWLIFAPESIDLLAKKVS